MSVSSAPAENPNPEATKGRRRSLRGSGLKAGTLFRSRHPRKDQEHIRHLVMEDGSLVRVEVDDEGHVYKPAPRLTKKERSRLKKQRKPAIP